MLPAFFGCFFLFQNRPPAEPAEPRRPKNIVLMVGDGMGLTQVTAGFYAARDTFFLRQFPVTGLSKTHASDYLITDSAAGATAFSCGCKTYNGAIGMCADKTACPTILEQAKAAGLATGMVTTSSITHATPASFVAHVAGRSEMEAIAAFFVQAHSTCLSGAD